MEPIHVLRIAHIAGESHKQFVDDVQLKPTDGGDNAAGDILKKVSNHLRQISLQNDPKAAARRRVTSKT